jgi:hypothetical protein
MRGASLTFSNRIISEHGAEPDSRSRTKSLYSWTYVDMIECENLCSLLSAALLPDILSVSLNNNLLLVLVRNEHGSRPPTTCYLSKASYISQARPTFPTIIPGQYSHDQLFSKQLAPYTVVTSQLTYNQPINNLLTTLPGLTLHSRIRLLPESDARRGTISYIGKVPEIPGLGSWIGVTLDEPTGKNDGSVKGNRYFECSTNCGVFVRPERCEAGEFPPLDLGDEDMEEL